MLGSVVGRVGGTRFSRLGDGGGPLAMIFPAGRQNGRVRRRRRRRRRQMRWGVWDMSCRALQRGVFFSPSRLLAGRRPRRFVGAVDGRWACDGVALASLFRPAHATHCDTRDMFNASHCRGMFGRAACRAASCLVGFSQRRYGVNRFGPCVTKTTVTGEFPDTGESHLIGHGGTDHGGRAQINNPCLTDTISR
jgi:hypothetical protein